MIFWENMCPRLTGICTRVQYFELSSQNDSFQDLLFPFIYACTILNYNHHSLSV